MNRLLRLTTLLCVAFALVHTTPLDEVQHNRSTRRVVFQSFGLGQPVVMEQTRSSRPSMEEYAKLRSAFVQIEESRVLGSNLTLNDDEAIANQIIMTAKDKEFKQGFSIPHLFNPSQHFFSVLQKIRDSELFKLLQSMPKGAVLHAHDTALCSTDYVITLTYKENLWLCINAQRDVLEFRFAESQPQSLADCWWELTAKVRSENGTEKFDAYLRERLSLYPTEKFVDNNYAWQEFGKIFRLVDGLLTYAPVWEEYYYQALNEFYADGVQYVEVRTTLPQLYALNGTLYPAIETARLYKTTLERFMAKNPDFIGSKIIYAPVRSVNVNNASNYLHTAIELKYEVPEIFAGFDLVGQEELGRPLIDFLPVLLAVPEDIDFYFHAGETNWYGSTTDENVIDAVLLGTKRVGHGYALIKHPSVLSYMKEQDIAVEVNPISNQVLQLVTDLRNHPCSHYFADNYPVVISSDDPSFWRASPLSHDFYVAFLGIASAHADLRLLKQLAINSIKYSAMDAAQKEVAAVKWQKKWDEYIDQVRNSAAIFSNHID